MKIPSLPSRLAPLTASDRDAVLALIRDCPHEPASAAWLEKLRRFCSLYGRRLPGAIRHRFGNGAGDHAVWMVEALANAAQNLKKSDQAVDVPLLNAALWALDAAPRSHDRYSASLRAVEGLLSRLKAFHRNASPARAIATSAPEANPVPEKWISENHQAPSLVVLCPNRFSVLTIATLGLLRAYGVPVAGIIHRKITWRRFRQELRRDGLPLFAKRVWRKLVVRGDENPAPSPLNATHIVSAVGSDIKDVSSYAAKAAIPFISVAEFEDAIDWLQGREIALGLFTGGGLIQPEFQAMFERGIVNCHMGLLPRYRGMDVVETPILEKRHQQVGLTTHLMDRGIDTGPVLQNFTIGTGGFASLEQCRNAVGGMMAIALVDTALGIGSGRLVPISQKERFPQHFFVHPRLREVLVGSAVWQDCSGQSEPHFLSQFRAILGADLG